MSIKKRWRREGNTDYLYLEVRTPCDGNQSTLTLECTYPKDTGVARTMSRLLAYLTRDRTDEQQRELLERIAAIAEEG